MKLEKLEQIMREEAEKVLAQYEEKKGIELDTDVKKGYIQTAVDTISADEAETEEEARELYRVWLEYGFENLEAYEAEKEEEVRKLHSEWLEYGFENSMTGDTVILEQGKADITAIYGWGLGEVAPLQTQLEEAKKRLTRLTGQEPREDLPPAEYRNAEQRIQGAIREHETLIESLERAIARAEHEEGAHHEQEL